MDPFTLAMAAALIAGGTGMQIYGNQRIQDRQRQAYDQYAQRSRKTEQEGLQAFDDQLDKTAQPAQTAGADAAAADRVATTNNLINSTSGVTAPPTAGSAPSIVGDTKAKTLSDALLRARGQIKAQARLQGLGDQAFETGLGFNNLANTEGNLAQRQQGFGNVLQARLATAPRAAEPWGTFGDLATTAGMLTVPFGFGPTKAYGSLGRFGKLMVEPTTGRVIGGL